MQSCVPQTAPPPLPPRPSQGQVAGSGLEQVEQGGSHHKQEPEIEKGSSPNGLSEIPTTGSTAHREFDVPLEQSAGLKDTSLSLKSSPPALPPLPPRPEAVLSMESENTVEDDMRVSQEPKIVVHSLSEDTPRADQSIARPGLSTSSVPPVNTSETTHHRPNLMVDCSSISEASDASTDPPPSSNNASQLENQTLEELENLEIDEFLRRTSKHLHEITVQSPCDSEQNLPQALPKLSDFSPSASSSSWSQINWLGYVESYLVVQLESHLPSTLISPESLPRVSFNQLKVHLERCYVLAPPEFWHTLLEGNIGDLYRWKNPTRSAKYCLVYWALWINDLIPSFLIGYILYCIIQRRLYPPPVSQLKRESVRRRKLCERAEKISNDGLWGGGNPNSSMLAKGIGGTASVFATPAIPHLLDMYTTRKDIAPDKDKQGIDSTKVPDQIGIYSLGRGLYSTYGSSAQYFLTDCADLGEKMKNLYLWRRPEACYKACLKITVILIYCLIVPQKWILKNALGWMGLEFWFIFWFIERNPKLRKIGNPLWWVLLDVPSDAEFALDILRSRAARVKSSHEDESSRRKGKGIAAKKLDHVEGCSGVEERATSFESERLKRWGTKVVEGSSETYRKLRKNRLSLDSKVPILNATKDPAKTRKVDKHRAFAMLNGKAPGNLIVGIDEISFEPMKGFRTKVMSSTGTFNSSLDTDSSSTLSRFDSIQSMEGVKPGPSAIEIQGNKINKLKKTRSFGWGLINGDGIEIKLEDGRIIRFENVSHRDDIFSKILLLTSLSNKGWALGCP